MSTIPNMADRNQANDLRVLGLAVVMAGLSFNDSEELTGPVVESPDLLPLYVSGVLGAEFKMDWSSATEEECARERVWAGYCCDLFDQVKGYVEKLLQG
jgi:hypothetical protein